MTDTDIPNPDLEAQLATVREGLRGVEIESQPSDLSNRNAFDYLYRQDTLLTRDQDAEVVRRAIVREFGPDAFPDDDHPYGLARTDPEDPRPGDARIAGVTRLTPVTGLAVPDTLDLLDARLGIGAVTPEHVFSVAGHACGATEPRPVGPGPSPRPFPDRLGLTGGPGACPDTSGRGVRVAVVDTGLVASATSLPWMAGVTGDPEPINGGVIEPYSAHGSFVAGCIRAMAPATEVTVFRGLQRGGAQLETALGVTIQRAAATSPDILVVSFVAETRLELTALGLDPVFKALRSRPGLVICCPAGNGGMPGIQYPAGYPDVTAVGALSANWQTRAGYSNFGGWVTLSAPGTDIVNAFATGTFQASWPSTGPRPLTFDGLALWSGTSFSAPIVAGLIAARMSATGENAPRARQRLLDAANRAAVPGIGPVLTPTMPFADLFGTP